MLAYMLGHHPDEFGLVLSEDGSIPLKELQQALIREPGWGFVRRQHLDQVVGLMQPPAFAVEGERIRCLQPGALPRRRPGLPPPPLLYLAIAPKVHEHVWLEGLKAAAGRELLLARTPAAALKLGKRRAPRRFWSPSRPRPRPRPGKPLPDTGRSSSWSQACPGNFCNCRRPRRRRKSRRSPRPRHPRPRREPFGSDCRRPPANRPSALTEKAKKESPPGRRAPAPSEKIGAANRKHRRSVGAACRVAPGD